MVCTVSTQHTIDDSDDSDDSDDNDSDEDIILFVMIFVSIIDDIKLSNY